jgi:hypothetical protein
MKFQSALTKIILAPARRFLQRARASGYIDKKLDETFKSIEEQDRGSMNNREIVNWLAIIIRLIGITVVLCCTVLFLYLLYKLKLEY